MVKRVFNIILYK